MRYKLHSLSNAICYLIKVKRSLFTFCALNIDRSQIVLTKFILVILCLSLMNIEAPMDAISSEEMEPIKLNEENYHSDDNFSICNSSILYNSERACTFYLYFTIIVI